MPLLLTFIKKAVWKEANMDVTLAGLVHCDGAGCCFMSPLVRGAHTRSRRIAPGRSLIPVRPIKARASCQAAGVLIVEATAQLWPKGSVMRP